MNVKAIRWADFLSFIDPRELWMRTKLRNRIALSSAMLLLLLVTAFALVLFQFLSRDKASYAFDAAFAESESIAATLSHELIRRRDSEADFTFVPFTETRNANQVNLIRWPEKNEIFFTEIEGTKFAFIRDPLGTVLYSDSTVFFKSLKEKIPESTILATTTGEIIEFGGRSPNLVKKYIREFSSAGVKKGVHNFVLDGSNKTFAFSEAQISNIVVITDAFVEEAQLEIRRITIVVFASLSAFVLLSSAMTAFLIRRSLAPLSSINEAASQIANGNFSYQIAYEYRDEVAETFLRIDTMKTLLKIRDSKLTRTSDYLHQVLQIVRATVKESDARSALIHALQSLASPQVFNQEVYAAYYNHQFEIEADKNGQTLTSLSKFFSTSTMDHLIEGIVDSHGSAQKLEDDVYIYEEHQLIFCDLRLNPKNGEHRGWLIVGPLNLHLLDVATLRFLGAFISGIHSTLENIELKNVAVEQGRMQLALEAAAKIQSNLVIRAQIPDAVEISSKSQCAESVGGDWYGTFYHAPSRTLYCYMTDATGHGLNATLLVSSVRGAVEAMHILHQQTPAEEMTSFLPDCAMALDGLIAEVSGGELTMTVFMLALSLEDGKVSFLNFAHPSPLIFSPDRAPTILNGDSGQVSSSTVRDSRYDSLGSRQLQPSNRPQVTVAQLQHNQVLCLYTDGLIETSNKEGEFLGRRRARQIVSSALSKNDHLDSAVSEVFKEIEQFCSGRPLDDDISLLLVRRAA